MSGRVIGWAFGADADLSPTQLLVLVAFADNADDAGRCWPSKKTIADKTHLNVASVYRAIQALSKKGLFSEEVDPDGRPFFQLHVEFDGRAMKPGFAECESDSQSANADSQSANADSQSANAIYRRTVIEPSQKRQVGAASHADAVSHDVEVVWRCYVEAMSPRRLEIDADQRKVIRKALEVASADECCRAILGCASSDFHMGKADASRYQGRPAKYNKLSQILRGRQGRETTRERIDYFIDLHEKSGKGGGNLTSAEVAVMSDAKLAVQRGWRFKDDPEKVAAAERAEAWLVKHGVEVKRKADGYPTFQAAGMGA